MTTTHPSANDSGLNLDHLEARTQNMDLVIARLEQIVSGCDNASERAEEALICARAARAALANQPAPTVPTLPERDHSKPAEQQGLFHKFDVRRTDGSDQPGGKHHGCRYYVLDLDHDQHAPAAMQAYAAAARSTHPQLAADIEAEFGAAQQEPVAAPQQAAAPGAKLMTYDEFFAEARRLGCKLPADVCAALAAAPDYSAPGTPEAPKPVAWMVGDELYRSYDEIPESHLPPRCHPIPLIAGTPEAPASLAQLSAWRQLRGHIITDAINGDDIKLPAQWAGDLLALFDVALPRASDPDNEGEDESAAQLDGGQGGE